MTRTRGPTVIDLFCGGAGGWSLGLHRAGYRTVAACEADPWRRAMFAANFPGVRMYDDVRELTAGRIISDLGYRPDLLVGSPPCQDASAANTRGQGVDGERTGLFFPTIRLVGDLRPRWVALENVPRLRTRGADRVLGALEEIGYSAWPFVVGAHHVRANHKRERVWIIAFDPAQIGHGGGGHGDTGRMGTVRHMLHQAMLPTPTKSDGGAEPPGVTGRKLRTYLATPAKRDFRSAKASEQTMRGNARPLNEHLANAEMMLTPTKTGNLTAPSMLKWAGARALAKMLASHGLTGTAALPITYGWIMGYPPSWLLRPAIGQALSMASRAASSPPMATPSCRKSRKP